MLRKIFKTVTTRCHLSKLKCTKFNFGWGSVPDPAAWGCMQRTPDPLAEYEGPTYKG